MPRKHARVEFLNTSEEGVLITFTHWATIKGYLADYSGFSAAWAEDATHVVVEGKGIFQLVKQR